MDPDLKAACDQYIKSCFNEVDKKQILGLVASKDHDQLRKRMLPRIAFGTSGLRSKMEAGSARMNDLTVFQASLGLRDYMMKTIPDAKRRGIVVGHDHRHNSQRFSQIVEAVFAPVMKVYIFGTLVHTPLVPFSVKQLNAAAGVMITASHNPKQDNGYKVYWENACAIIPPHDHGIADAILNAVKENPRAEPQFSSTHENTQNVYEAMTKAYFGRVFESLAQLSPSRPPKKDFKFCYTPMHGVGLIYARVAMSGATAAEGKSEMIVVFEQALPDPDFPTVKFPNPEEAGALDLAIQTANAEGVDIIVATDPDADRLGVAEKVNGKWHILTGNEIGLLLAAFLISQTTPDSSSPSSSDKPRAILSSAVSSKVLESVARKEGIHWEETLTGFKWLGNRALALREQGYQVLLAYEESIGFMPLDIVNDKDGILSMSILLLHAKSLYADGSTLSNELHRLYERYGFFASADSYFVIPDAHELKRVMYALRKPEYPTQLAGRRVTRVRDLTHGYDSSTEDKKPRLPVSATSEMLTFWFEDNADGSKSVKDFDGASMTIRGSGTEPKLKYYIEAQSTSMEKATTAAKAIERDFISIWLKDFKLQHA